MLTVSQKLKFIRDSFGSISLDRGGHNVAVKCPVCNDNNKKKLSINLETWQAHCWVCGLKSANLVIILKKYISSESADFFKKKIYRNAIEIDDIESIETRLTLPDDFLLLANNLASIDPDVKKCITYLYSRGLSENDLWLYKLGTSKTGRYRRRIIFPSFDQAGKLNYYVARSIDPTTYLKYLNPTVNKNDIIFNEINIKWDTELTVTEGPFDLIKSNINTTCILGSSLSIKSKLFCQIIKHKTPILLALDADMGKKMIQIGDLLSAYDCKVRILNLGNFNDVGEMSRVDFNKAKSDALELSPEESLIRKISSINSGSKI